MSGKKDPKSYYEFDYVSLEKAAQAAKYLDASKNAKEAVQLASDKEKTKQLEYEESKVKLEIQKSQIQEEERRKTVQYETEMAKRRAEYQVQLELQRDQQKLQQKEALAREARQRDEESIQRQEQLKRDTLEYEYQLKASLKQQKIQEELRLKRELADKNQDFVKDLMQNQEQSRRETQKQKMTSMFNMISSSMGQVMSNPKILTKAAYIAFCVFGTYHATQMGVTLLTRMMLGKFGKPQLVRETSKIYSNNYLTLPFIYGQKFVRKNLLKHSEAKMLQGVILDKKLEDQLREISYAVLNRKKHYAPAKNMLFYGPPGTGKTLFAKKLAMESGLEYAVMVGADIAPLGPLAVTELNRLFDWAEQQPNGMVLFIDEADAFLRSRKGEDISEAMRHSINSFLYRTGTPSEKVILIMATNNPDQLDEAVHDRIDEVVGFNLPNENERRIMLFHYLVKYCQPPQTLQEKMAFIWKYPRSIYHGKKLIRMEGVSKEIIEKIAKNTEGFSGREITKMVVAWHDAAFTLPDAVLTPDLMEKVLEKFHLQHKLKENWNGSDDFMMEKMIFLDQEAEGKSKNKEQMKKRQEEIMNKINEERMAVKDFRDASIEQQAQKIQKSNKQV